MKLLPKDVYECSNRTALSKLLFSVSIITLSVFLLALSPWYLLPVGWLLMGTAITGLFSVGYSCAKNMFFKNRIINYFVGTLCMMPLMYPLEYWRYKAQETASKAKKHKDELLDFSLRVASSPFWFLSSVVQWVQSSFIFKYSRRMVLSAACMYLFAALFFPLITYGLGIWGLFKFYLIPLLVFHFWMSTFLKVNIVGLLEEIAGVDLIERIKRAKTTEDHDNDDEAKSSYDVMRALGLVVCRYPRWVQLLSHDFNYGITLVQTAAGSIPTYKWRDAIATLKKELGGQSEVPEYKFGWRLLVGKVDLSVPKEASVSAVDTITSFLSKINWVTAIFLFGTPILSVYGILTTAFNWRTYVLSFFACNIAGIGVTAGYHRLFSHRSWDACFAVKLVLTIMATSAFEMSALDWCWDHRAHHRFTDTDKDPYNVNRGFWWAHMGWLLFKREADPDSDISDLKRQWLLRFQHTWYAPLSVFFGFVVPTLIAGYFWGDWRGGFLIAGVASKVAMHHCTFSINSWAHYFGEHTYTDQRSPKDNGFTSLFTWGEGYHNFHHEFPYDYRNGIKWNHYDPGKWVIWSLERLGLAYNLKRFPKDLFAKGKLQMAQKKIEKEKTLYDWGPKVETLPRWTSEHLLNMLHGSHQSFVVCQGFVYDVSSFMDKHPGGKKMIEVHVGKDITKQFNGSVYNHSFAARNILDTLRVAVLQD